VGHAAKLARGFLATQFGDDLVTIVDIDYYLLWFERWAAHLKCTPIDGLLTLGYNMYHGTESQGKYPMYLGTARSSTFARFLNPGQITIYDKWIRQFKGMRVFDDSESPYKEYGHFSDESLFRALLSKNSPPVTWVNRPSSWKRIDRSKRHPVTKRELDKSSDVFPNRPLGDCSTYFFRTAPVLKYIGIWNASRDANFIERLQLLNLKSRDWGQKRYKDVKSLYECSEAKSHGL
jgi:hypothetical protein